jgi:outer membrane lipoprotein-sorting protein
MMAGNMKNKIMLAAVSVMVLFAGCKTMETADKKMQTVDKKVGDADAKFRKNVGLKPYKKDGQPGPADSN